MHQADWHFAPFGWCFRKTARPVVFSTLWMYWCLWSKTFNQTSSCYSLVGGSGRSMGTFASISSATVVGITRFPLLSATQDEMDCSIIHRVLIPKLGVSWSKWRWQFGTYLLYELWTLPFGLSFSECRFTPQREIAPNSYTLTPTVPECAALAAELGPRTSWIFGNSRRILGLVLSSSCSFGINYHSINRSLSGKVFGLTSDECRSWLGLCVGRERPTIFYGSWR